MLSLLHRLIIYLLAVWTCKVLDLACYLLKNVIPELPAAASSLIACGSNNRLPIALGNFACLPSKVCCVNVLVVFLPSATEERKQGEVCTQPQLTERGRGGGRKEKERITGSSRNKEGVGWHVKSCSEALVWTMNSAGSASGIL